MLHTGYYQVPKSISLSYGNSGTGWASLRAADRKFCYQGTASNNNARNGDRFILKSEKSSLSEPCHENHSNIGYDKSLYLRQGESVNLSIPGGGCSLSSPASCLDTKAQLVLLFKQKE